MNYKTLSWEKVNAENVDPKVKQQIFTTDNIMVVRYVYEPGLHFPEHSHPQEQTTIVEKGRLIYTIDGKEIEVKEGELITIKPNVKHGTLTPPDITSVAISIFSPVSQELLIQK